MTTITFKRSGGVVGNEVDLDLDTNTLPENDAQRLLQLITNADFFNLPENLAPQTTPDEFQYTITVKAGHTSHTVHCTDTTMPAPLRLLVKELTMLKVLH